MIGKRRCSLRKLRSVLAGAAAAIIVLATPAMAETHWRCPSVTGSARIQIPEPVSVFEFSIHASGFGQAANGLLRIEHTYGDVTGWLVAKITGAAPPSQIGHCLVVRGSVAVATAKVQRAHLIPVMRGDRVGMTVYDNSTDDDLGVSLSNVARCQQVEPPGEITSGDFTVRH